RHARWRRRTFRARASGSNPTTSARRTSGSRPPSSREKRKRSFASLRTRLLREDGQAEAGAAILVAVIKHPAVAVRVKHARVLNGLAVPRTGRRFETGLRVAALPREAVARVRVAHSVFGDASRIPHVISVVVTQDAGPSHRELTVG